ncbi:MAG: hypothetical protein ACJ8F7_18510 [Gemmataceae bacterium]
MRRVIVTIAIAALVAAVAAPGHAGLRYTATKKGTWTFTDFTPDPTADSDVMHHCTGATTLAGGQHLPPSPMDHNVQPVKISGPGMLMVTGHNTGDWAVEIIDPKGVTIAGDDSNPPDAESVMARLSKPGTYKVMWCNLTGEPQISVSYSLKTK